MTPEQTKTEVSRRLSEIPDQGLADVIRGILFDSRNQINWLNAVAQMEYHCPELAAKS
jgi:hypothetical protein